MKVSKIWLERKLNDGKFGSMNAGTEVVLEDKDKVEDAWTLARESIAKGLESAKEIQPVASSSAKSSPKSSTTKKAIAQTKPVLLEGEALKKFIAEHADGVAALRNEMGAEIVTDEAAAQILARQLGETTKVKAIGSLDGTEVNFAIEATLVSVSGPKPFTKGDGSDSTYRRVILQDATGDISTTIWGNENPFSGFHDGDLLLVSNIWKLGEYNGKLQLQLGRGAKVTLVSAKTPSVEEYLL